MMLMTAIATAICVILEKPLINCFLKGEGSPEDIAKTFEISCQYLRIMLFGLLPFAFAMMYSSALRELGETRVPMIASITAILVNLVFNYLLIFGKFGFPRIDGAAWNPMTVAEPDTTIPVEDRPTRGLGVLLYKKLADQVRYVRENDQNVIQLRKTLRE